MLMKKKYILNYDENQHGAVVARDGASADALASAISVAGPQHAPALLARFPGARVYFEAP